MLYWFPKMFVVSFFAIFLYLYFFGGTLTSNDIPYAASSGFIYLGIKTKYMSLVAPVVLLLLQIKGPNNSRYEYFLIFFFLLYCQLEIQKWTSEVKVLAWHLIENTSILQKLN